jgi:hypothetical protein
MRWFLLFFFMIIIMLALIGMELFAFKTAIENEKLKERFALM